MANGANGTKNGKFFCTFCFKTNIPLTVSDGHMMCADCNEMWREGRTNKIVSKTAR